MSVTERPPPDLYDPACPTRVLLDRIGDKWTVLIVLSLERGTLRFSQLRTAVAGITPKVLTQSLRTLERDGIVTRRVYAEVPPRVEYTLTPLGRSLNAPIQAIADWAQRHVGEVLDARDAHDERAA